MELSSVQLAFVGLLITAGSALWALFKMVTTATEGVRREAFAADEGMRKEFAAQVDKLDAVTSKARHDMANTLQVSLTKLEADIERLKRETVRREDMAAIEQRLTGMFLKIENKVDTLSERIAGFATLEKQVLTMDRRLEGLIERMETRNKIGGGD